MGNIADTDMRTNTAANVTNAARPETDGRARWNQDERRFGSGVLAALEPQTGPGRDRLALFLWVELCARASWDGDGEDGDGDGDGNGDGDGAVGRCSLSLSRLAAIAGIDRRTARKGLSLLDEAGLLRVERLMSGGRVDGARYTLHPHALGRAA